MKYITRIYYEDGKFASEIVIDSNFDSINGKPIENRSDAIEYVKTYILKTNQYCIIG